MLKHTLKKITLSLLIILTILEVGLRFSGRLQTYSEKNFGAYQSLYNSKDINHLFVWHKNDTIMPKQTEFEYAYQTNSYGLLATKNMDTCKPNRTFVFLGDSFVFGVGSPQDSSLPVLLSEKIKQNIINAGIPGSDPFFQQKLLEDIFSPKGFNSYIFMVNFSDIYDYVIRGGEERFLENNMVMYRKAPWFEPVYQYSYIFRAAVHILLKADYSLLSQGTLKKLKEESVIEYVSLFENMAKNKNILVVLQPYARQYTSNDKMMSEVLNYKYLDQLDGALKIKGIKTLNLNSQLKSIITEKNYLEYSWNLDGHFNSNGYQLLSQIISKELKTKLNLFFTKDH